MAFQMLPFVAVAQLLTSTSLIPCPISKWNTTRHPSACPSDGKCCVAQYFQAPGCVFAGTTKCCSPGPPLPISTTLKNCLVIGDSVSEQYTPHVANLLASECLVQHAPSVGGGSANNVASGLSNLQHCRWLRTALRPDVAVNPTPNHNPNHNPNLNANPNPNANSNANSNPNANANPNTNTNTNANTNPNTNPSQCGSWRGTSSVL